MDILKRITDLNTERGWSPYRLAKQSGLSQSTVANLFNRDYMPSISTLESLCQGFGISLSEFFSTDDKATYLTEEQANLLFEWSKLNSEQKESIASIIRNYNK